MSTTTFRLLEHATLDLALDVTGMGLTDAWLEEMAPRVADALEEMTALELGSIANHDEGRRVGHYWLRSSHLAPSANEQDAIERTLDAIDVLAGQLIGRFKSVVHIGVGGSALGPQLLIDALQRSDDAMQVRFLDNIDPDGVADTLATLDLSTALVVVVSKSGRTPETMGSLALVEERLSAAGLDLAERAVAITCESSLLDQRAHEEGWLGRLPMWDWVGGRTSMMSAVGLFPAALTGIDCRAVLRGAALMDTWTRNLSVTENPAMMMALSWLHATDGQAGRANVVLPYNDRLELFAKYLQQLIMESLGKRLDRSGVVVHQGLTVYGNKGATDQHAYVQQLREGPDDHFVTFVEVLTPSSELATRETRPGVRADDILSALLAGTRAALAEVGRRHMTLTLTRLDEVRFGALVALFERAVGFYASLVNINAYHQPGVEAGKRVAAEVLEVQAKLLSELAAGRSGPAADFAARLKIDEALAFHVLRRMAATGRAVATGEGLSRVFSA